MLTAAALLLMYPFGGFLFFSLIEKLLPDGGAWILLFSSMSLIGLILIACSLCLYFYNRHFGNPMKQWNYALSIVLGLLLTWRYYGYFLISEYIILPLLRIF
ncbi:MAG: hypothetical protein E7445_05265 [Ruminococcaceae bacterium]|nr:hypothetical protein [Oscillospiraceae bacterium]